MGQTIEILLADALHFMSYFFNKLFASRIKSARPRSELCCSNAFAVPTSITFHLTRLSVNTALAPTDALALPKLWFCPNISNSLNTPATPVIDLN